MGAERETRVAGNKVLFQSLVLNACLALALISHSSDNRVAARAWVSGARAIFWKLIFAIRSYELYNIKCYEIPLWPENPLTYICYSKSLLSSSPSTPLSLLPVLFSDCCDPRDPWELNRLSEVWEPFFTTSSREGGRAGWRSLWNACEELGKV